ncbi:hypothetical protein SLA2020_419650 [Shorea laevis]
MADASMHNFFSQSQPSASKPTEHAAASSTNSSPRRFPCPYCTRDFATSKSRAGHQKAHKHERAAARQEAKPTHHAAAPSNNSSSRLFPCPTVPGGLPPLKLAPAIRKLTSASETLLLGQTFWPTTCRNTPHFLCSPLLHSSRHRRRTSSTRTRTLLPPTRSLGAFWAIRLLMLSPLPLMRMILPIWTSPSACEEL